MYFRILILIFIASLTLSAQQVAIPEVSAADWWVNVHGLQARISSKGRLLFFDNYSEAAVQSFQLGCISLGANKIKVHRKFKSEADNTLEGKEKDKIYAVSLDYVYSNPSVCKQGKLAIIRIDYENGLTVRIR